MTDCTGGVTDGDGQCTSPTQNQEICARQPMGPAQHSAAPSRRSAQFGIACRRNRCLRPVTTTHAALLRPATRPPRLGSRPRPGPGLSFGLIHPCPEPFTDVHPDRVCAVREQWRPPVNAGQHCWKACWGQPLRSSNLLSSATSDQAIHNPGHAFGLGLQGCVVSFVVSFILRISV
jgi:hypothetical protein